MFDGLWMFRYKLLKQRTDQYERERDYYKEKCEQLFCDYNRCENELDMIKNQLRELDKKFLNK
ncbi:hypothetical protein BC5_0009 [Bacillus phage BC-5]|uniref:Uncharacterized protein n=1 Tax=Bacillus phage BC-5 TaxID=3020389 RepID=A0AAF0BYC9_9CAUD|nr:hypothetical protein BC5_0009 [Bacillus phage BC-5]